MPRREHISSAVPGLHAALVADYVRESRVIDARLKVEAGLDDAEQLLMNEGAPHSRQMRRMAQRLRGGALFAIAARRVQRLPGADAIPWLADWRGGVLVGTDDTVLKAPAHMPVHV